MSTIDMEQSTEMENVSNLMMNFGEPSPMEASPPSWPETENQDLNMEESFAAMASIRSSRRRIKGTSVISINKDNIQKYLEKGKTESEVRPATAPATSSAATVSVKSPIKDALKKSVVQNLNKKLMEKSIDIAKGNLSSPEPSPPKADTPEKKIVSQDICARKLQKWWTNLLIFKCARFTQFDRWTSRQAKKVFAVFLGCRVRRMFRSIDVRTLRTVIHDVYQTLYDLLLLDNPIHLTVLSLQNMERIEAFMKEIRNNTFHNSCRGGLTLSESELGMAKSMVKQLSVEKEKLHKVVFGKARWSKFPAPGYWDLSEAISKLIIKQRNMLVKQLASHHPIRRDPVGASPARAIRTPKHEMMETPPNFKRVLSKSKNGGSAGKLVGGSDSVVAMMDSSSTGGHHIHGQQQPVILQHGQYSDPSTLMEEVDADLANELRVLRAPLSAATASTSASALATPTASTAVEGGSLLKTPQPLSDLLHLQDRQITGSGGVGRIGSAPRHTTPGHGAHGGSPRSVRCRNGAKPHIQLDILSAEKLMPAKKGGKARDVNTGEAIPDRIPCLKVTLLLPPWMGGPGSPPAGAEMKKVAHVIRDFEVVTLNPQWNTTFILNLPCTRTMLKSIIPGGALSGEDNLDDAIRGLDQFEYDRMVEDLLLWYSHGILNIEVKDGERFNEEIFLGHTNILLAGLTRSIKKHDFDKLEISGNFQLEKAKPSQRVSGSIKLHAYLHAPERSYLVEMLHVSPSGGRKSYGLRSSSSIANVGLVDAEVASAAASATARLKSISKKLNAGLFSSQANAVNGGGNESAESDRESPRLTSPPPATSSSSQYMGRVPLPASSFSSGAGSTGPVYSSNFMKSLAKTRNSGVAVGASHQPTEEEHVSPPQLEESVNVKYVVTGQSKVLKKLPEHRPVDSVLRDVNASHQSRIPKKSSRASTSLNDSSMSNAGASRRIFIQDITKQLDGLSAVQHSTETMLGHFNRQLHERRNGRPSTAGSNGGDSESAEIADMLVNNYMTYNQHRQTAAAVEEGADEEEEDEMSPSSAADHSENVIPVSHRMVHSNSASLIEEDDQPEMSELPAAGEAATESEYDNDGFCSGEDEVVVHTDNDAEGDGEEDEGIDADWQDISNELQDIVKDCLPAKYLEKHPLVQSGADVMLSLVHDNNKSYAIEDYFLDQQTTQSMHNNTTDESQLTGMTGEDDSELLVVKKN